jgi:H+-transporting ATPase
MEKEKKTFTQQELDEKSNQNIIEELSADPQDGLSGKEALKRMEIYGENAVEEEHVNAVLEFFSHFWGPIPWMIEIAAILAGSVAHNKWPHFKYQ